MEEFSERELFRVRLRLVDLLKSFFQAEPDVENISRWRGIFMAMAKEQVNPLFDTAVRDIARQLREKKITDIQNEYYELFTNPFGTAQVNTMASYYLDGRSFGQTLVALRGLLKEAKLEREAGVVDSEDSLPMLLDIFASLIEEEKTGDCEAARQLQKRLLVEYLEPFVREFSAALNRVGIADFYSSCCRLLRGYLDLEKGLVVIS